MIQVDTPDGGVAEFPDGTSPDVIRNALRAKFGGGPAKGVAQDISKMSAGDVAKSALSNIGPSALNVAKQAGEGLIELAKNPAGPVNAIADIGTGILEHFFPSLGSGNPQYAPIAEKVGQAIVDRYGSAAAIKKAIATDPVGVLADVSTVFSGGETALARLPGVLGKVGKVAGAIDPLALAGKGVGAVAGTISKDTAAERATLSQAGVTMTPGQMVGGTAKGVEDALTSIPILGDFVNSGRARSVESFNEAVMNQALAPIGEKLSKGTVAGHDAVDEVATKLGKAYDTLLPQLTWVPDADFAQDLRSILQQDVAVLPKQYAEQYMRILKSRLPVTPMSGADFKGVESELTKLANDYRPSADGAQRGLASALDNTITAMRTTLERGNPGAQAELAKINSGYAMYARIRDAAARRTAGAGVFTPNDLLAAVKKGDKSVAKGNFARGDALMQTFAEAAQKVLPSKLPDSGTAKRLMTAGGIGAASYILNNPLIALAGAAAAAPYTRTGMAAVNASRGLKKLPLRKLGLASRLIGASADQ